MKKLFIFDFDATLYKTPEPLTGTHIYKEYTGVDWLHRGWWSRPETLDTKIFDIPLNEWVYSEYLKAKSEEDTYSVLVTGRIKKLKLEVLTVLEKDGIEMDEVHCNWGGPTLNFKLKVFDSLVNKFKDTLIEVMVYDDRDEHIGAFIDWSLAKKKETGIQINIIHVK